MTSDSNLMFEEVNNPSKYEENGRRYFWKITDIKELINGKKVESPVFADVPLSSRTLNRLIVSPSMLTGNKIVYVCVQVKNVDKNPLIGGLSMKFWKYSGVDEPMCISTLFIFDGTGYSVSHLQLAAEHLLDNSEKPLALNILFSVESVINDSRVEDVANLNNRISEMYSLFSYPSILQNSPDPVDTRLLYYFTKDSDFTIKFKRGYACQPYKTHKCILALKSDVFADMFDKGKTEETIFISHDAYPSSDIAILIFFYSGEMCDWYFRPPFQMLDFLLHVADKYKVELMKMYCIKKLAENMDDSNVVKCIEVASKYGIYYLKRDAMNYIVNYKTNLQTSELAGLSSKDICEVLYEIDNRKSKKKEKWIPKMFSCTAVAVSLIILLRIFNRK